MDALSATPATLPYGSGGVPSLPLSDVSAQTLPEIVSSAPLLITAKPLSERLRVSMRVKDLNGIVHRIERFVRCSETDSVMVIHRAARNRDYDGYTWVRPRSAFDEVVLVAGVIKPRFTEVV